jgi:RNA-binding protein
VRSDHRKYLKGLAHRLKPVVLIGQGGLTSAVVQAVDAALHDHELIKIKFNAFREKEEKASITAAIEKQTGAQWVGSIGHITVFYRPHPDAESRKIQLPAG